MRIVRALVIAAAFIPASAAFCQLPVTTPGMEPPLGIIDTVMIGGNQKTKPYVILNEMTLKPGSVATYGAMDFDRSRIYNLGLFTRVDLFYDSLGSVRFLYVDVRERWYLIPIPIFGFRDGDTKKPYFGAGFLNNNVGGRNQKLYVSAIFGFNPSLALAFQDPLIDHENRMYGAGQLSINRFRNQSVQESAITGDFDELHYNINLTLGKRFSLYEIAGINAGYQIVDISDYRPGRTVSSDGKDRFLYAKINYTYDSRDLAEYAMQGMYIDVFLLKSGFGESAVSTARFGADFRRYVPFLSDLSMAGHVFGSFVAGGDVPPYARVYFGYGERIRGFFNTVFEGENLFGSSVELRFSLLTPRSIQLLALPIPEEFAIWRFGISMTLFGDAGMAWFRGAGPALRSLATGYGGGIDFLLPYGYVVRAEYAINRDRIGQFILDLRGAF